MKFIPILFLCTVIVDVKMQRKIIHCDADCFFAAIEIRDNPTLKNKPIAVGGGANSRGVIATCNYIARKYGIHSAMASFTALKLCPALIIIPGRMHVYKEASTRLLDIFKLYSSHVEPLSLDEAFLDVSGSSFCQGSATLLAKKIQAQVQHELGITISVGVAPNKFLAKIASDWKKPNGLFVVTPTEVDDFVAQLSVQKIFGVGPVTANRLRQLGIETCAQLQTFTEAALCAEFGVFGLRLYKLCRGQDNRAVQAASLRKSLSVEHTFPVDLPNTQACVAQLPYLLKTLNARLGNLNREYRVIKAFVKVKYSDFTVLTHERLGLLPHLDAYQSLVYEALQGDSRPVRLLGVGVRFANEDCTEIQLPLFA